MANVIAILPGVSLNELWSMTITELGEWHERAKARAPKQD